jgi:hypothetical protein
MIKPNRMKWTDMQHAWREKRIAYRILVGKAEGEIPVGRPRRMWEDNNKMNSEIYGD